MKKIILNINKSNKNTQLSLVSNGEVIISVSTNEKEFKLLKQYMNTIKQIKEKNIQEIQNKSISNYEILKYLLIKRSLETGIKTIYLNNIKKSVYLKIFH